MDTPRNLGQADELVRTAFAAAKAGGKDAWDTMTLAVLKNRLLSLTDGDFDEKEYGASTMTEFTRLLSEPTERVVVRGHPAVRWTGKLELGIDTPFFRVERIQLTNFRCFKTLDVVLNPRCTVLVGENGAGKTTLITALSAALGAVLRGADSEAELLDVEDDTRREARELAGIIVRAPQFPVSVTATGWVCGAPVTWNVGQKKKSGRRAYSMGARRVLESTVELAQDADDTIFPAIAVYSTARSWGTRVSYYDSDTLTERTDGYNSCQEAEYSFDDVASWMRRVTYAEVQRGAPSGHLSAVRNAIRTVIPEAKRVYYDIAHEELVVALADGPVVSFNQLSDGYRVVIAMVADLAWRCAVLNPQFGENCALRTPGLVAIDEVGLHLHPKWQVRVLEDITRAFPEIQFIVTTHSPQVVASAKPGWVKVIRPALGDTVAVDGSYGKDTNSILEAVMGAQTRPAWALNLIAAAETHLERGEVEEAATLVEKITELWGAGHSVSRTLKWELSEARFDAGDNQE